MNNRKKTKTEIIELLDKKPLTLTDIYKALGRGQATIHEHIHMLLESGTIRILWGRPGKKYIYYELNR